jgi:hypothetical protein
MWARSPVEVALAAFCDEESYRWKIAVDRKLCIFSKGVYYVSDYLRCFYRPLKVEESGVKGMSIVNNLE